MTTITLPIFATVQAHAWLRYAVTCSPKPMLIGMLCLLMPAVSHAQGTDEPMAKGVQDNSFLIEEAYNQEPGVVQHILSARRQGRDWTLNFTQEWPLGSQDHQFSYTIPYVFMRSSMAHGVGDIFLNYRFQAMGESNRLPAFAPRLSLILPTGSERKSIGAGSVGYQINLPFSKVVSERVTLHANAGITSYANILGRMPVSFNLGGSAVYAVTRNFNLMMEVVGDRIETVSLSRTIEHERALTFSPGMRYAFNVAAGQLVAGVAMPVRQAKERTDVGAFIYLSFEHKFAP